MDFKTYIFLLLFLPLSYPSYATRQAIIFGGGPTPNDSQVSIELNTLWIADIISKHYGAENQTILFTDGNNIGVDVRGWAPPNNELGIYNPLARVFNKQGVNGSAYHSSHISDNIKPSDSDTVTTTLNNILNNSKPGDEILIIYQGHGRYNKNTNNNHFRLWQHTKLTVSDLESIMSKAPPETIIRFIFPQCFSGAFARLIYNNTNINDGLANGLRCGFLSQSEDLPSEGCTTSVNTNDYHDYSYYFFSALDGETINGAPLFNNPDLNGDSKITLREAHLYTLANAFSVDFSRSTSEAYLENWHHWYLNLLPIPITKHNIYNDIAEQIAERFNINASGTELASKAKRRLRLLNNSLMALKNEDKILTESIRKIQNKIKLQLMLRWPELEFPYTNQYRKVMLNQIDLIQNNITSQREYPLLVKAQNKKVIAEQRILDNEREIVQMKKILQILKLSRTLALFQNYASKHELDKYNQIVKCEESGL